jgi:DNA-binding NtrC family response regulator
VYEINDEGKRWLNNYSWPGNIRELKFLIQKVIIKTDQRIISNYDFQNTIDGENTLNSMGFDNSNLSYKEAKEIFVEKYFRKKLKMTGGNISKAAELSGISRQRLAKIIKQFHLNTTNDFNE